MPFDLATLTSTPDLRCVPAAHAKLVCAMRETHIARRKRICCGSTMARYFGSLDAVRAFHVFMDEAGCAWPDPIVLNPPCQPSFSYDEMLLVDLAIAAAKDERRTFDALVGDMIGLSGRNAIWTAAGRLMRHLVAGDPQSERRCG